MLKLVDILAIGSPERERLVEIDDAIGDLIRAVGADSEGLGLDQRTLSRAMVGVLVAAAARQAIAAYPGMSEADLGEAFEGLAKEAIDWASRRSLEPKRAAPDAVGDVPRANPRRKRLS